MHTEKEEKIEWFQKADSRSSPMEISQLDRVIKADPPLEMLKNKRLNPHPFLKTFDDEEYVGATLQIRRKNGWEDYKDGLKNTTATLMKIDTDSGLIFYWMEIGNVDEKNERFRIRFETSKGEVFSHEFAIVDELMFHKWGYTFWPHYGEVNRPSLVIVRGHFDTEQSVKVLFGDEQVSIKSVTGKEIRLNTPQRSYPSTVPIYLHHAGETLKIGYFTFMRMDRVRDHSPPSKRQRTGQSSDSDSEEEKVPSPPQMTLVEDITTTMFNASNGYSEALAIEIAKNPQSVNDKDSENHTPLYFAAEKNQLESAKILLEKGAKVNAEDEDGVTPLHLAAKGGHLDMIRLLLSHKADPNAQNAYGDSPLHFAAAQGQEEAAKLLYDNGADIHLPNEADDTPIQVANEFNTPFSFYPKS